ncbi:hypothetical protein AAHH88_00165 [Candidatus Hodgkinia cicadicola]
MVCRQRYGFGIGFDLVSVHAFNAEMLEFLLDITIATALDCGLIEYLLFASSPVFCLDLGKMH